jgi:SET domain-containing protein
MSLYVLLGLVEVVCNLEECVRLQFAIVDFELRMYCFESRFSMWSITPLPIFR